jgi:hypothetical protein
MFAHRSVSEVKCDIEVVRMLTSGPFAVNHIPQNLNAEAFAYAAPSDLLHACRSRRWRLRNENGKVERLVCRMRRRNDSNVNTIWRA